MHCKPIDNKDFQIASATIVGSAFPKFMEMGGGGGGGGGGLKIFPRKERVQGIMGSLSRNREVVILC